MELERLASLLSVAKLQEEIFGAITDRYQAFLGGVVFKRLSIKLNFLKFSKVDLRTGELLIDEPKGKKNEKSKIKKA